MAEYKLGRIRFVWKNEWNAATTYYKDDVIRYGGKTYICVVGHTSNSDFNVDLEYSPTKWNQMSDGTDWKGDWATGTFYKINDVVKYGGLLYICNDSHTSAATAASGLEADQAKWTLYAEGFDWKNDWSINTRYKVNDLVKYGGYTYVCNEGHTSAATTSLGLENDQSKWDDFNQGLEYKGIWVTGTRYKVNDVVKYGAGLWICTVYHTASAAFSTDSANWSQFVEAFEFEDDWNSSTVYQPGDVVRYGGNQYVSKTIHSNGIPSTDATNWDLFNQGFKFQSDWSIASSYKIGDVVRLNGYTYVAAQDSSSIVANVTNTTAGTNLVTVSDTTGIVANMAIRLAGISFGDLNTDATYYVKTVAGATTITISETPGGATRTLSTASGTLTATFAAKPPNASYWSLLNSGIRWQGPWQDDIEYVLGDAVRYGDNAYICVLAHRSEGDDGSSIKSLGGGAANSRPDQDVTGTYWNILSIGSEISVLTNRGDLVYYGGSGPARLPVGTQGQVLRSNGTDPEWVSLESIPYVYYVSTEGIDRPAPVRGLTLNAPWKTIRHACQEIEKGPINPNAQYLLELNRIFIQKEVSAWIRYQITNNISPFTTGFDYDEYKCERDVGFIIDRLIWDIGHGGNLKMRAAAQSFVNALGEGPFSAEEEDVPYSNLAAEADEGVAAYNYMLTLVENVLDNEAPTTIYQNSSDDSTAIATQYINTDLTAEAGVMATITSLVGIVTTAIADGDSTNIPARDVPQILVKVSTGSYAETLPIIVPAYTCILGDELRSTRVRPAASLIDHTDAYASIPSLNHLAEVISQVVTGTSVTPTSGNNVTQNTDYPTADAPESEVVRQLVQVMKHRADFLTRSMVTAAVTDPTGYDSSYLIGYGKARKLVKENKKFFQEEIIAWLAINYPTSKYQKTLTRRDVGYIIDALVYDLTFDGNTLSVQAGLAYYDGDDASQPQIADSIKALTIAAVNHLSGIVQAAALNNTVSALQSAIPQFRDTAGSAAAASLISSNISDIVSIINIGPAAVGTVVTLTDSTPTNGVNTTTALISAYNNIEGGDDFATIKTSVSNYLATNFSDVDYSDAKARRDAGYVLKAVCFDFMYNSNYQTIKAAEAYLRPTSSELFDRDDRIKLATRLSLQHAKEEAIAAASNATAEARIEELFTIVDDIIYGGSSEGDVCQTDLRNRDYAILKLEQNRNFIVAETTAYITDTFSDIITASSSVDNSLTISDTSWMVRGMKIVISSPGTAGLAGELNYYVSNIISSTKFSVSETKFGSTVSLSTTTGTSVAVRFVYNSDLCLRDVNYYIDALKWDLRYKSNYESRYVATYYANAMLGSQEENMYLLRDATGIRDQTLEGLNGDMTPENAFGTSRVTAGAYCSLDPGRGPADFRTWIISRSPYVQGVTTFGNAAIGQKIDGALHDGGNDSIVSNDFTQVISDGIGAWITNNGRAELVSVFSYYAHIGYLAEAGGRIRATNGNNSYGDFGAVAEGFDTTETPNTAIVDNRSQFNATVREVFTSGSYIMDFEFENAGSEYTEAEWTIIGGISAASVEADEFRDDAVFQVRLLDFGDDSSGQFGGDGYITNSNTAQGGTSSSLTIAATDGELSSAYVGMKLIITGGTGVGQFGIVDSYNSGSKLASIVKETDGTSGWDHKIPGTTIVSPDASSTYTIEPAISFSHPGFSDIEVTMPSSGTWSDVIYGSTAASYVSLSGTYTGSGTGATWSVIRNGSKYTVTQIASGIGYERLETITIDGSLLGGTSSTNDIVITITSVNSTTGAIQAFDFEGYGRGGLYVAVKNGERQGAYSLDGSSWVDETLMLPSTSNWSSLAYGLLDDGSSVGKTSVFVAVATGSNAAAYSTDGINWTAATLPANSNWVSVTFGNGKFVAISSNSTTVAVSSDGILWDQTGTLSTTGFVEVAYGGGKFVVINSGADTTNYALDPAVTWTNGGALPTSDTWTSVTWGNGRFVAVASDSNSGAFSLNGTSWTAMTLGSLDGSSVAGYQKVRYGQGLFMATAYISGESGEGYSYAATSENGIQWTARGLSESASPGSGGYGPLAFGNPQRIGYWTVLGKASGDHAVRVRTGARAKARASVSDNKIFVIGITEPGSGYNTAPTITITDPNNIYEAPTQVRIGKGALATPSFISRGTGYTTAEAEIDTGDGYADFFQSGGFIAVRRITSRPVPGSNIVFNDIPDQTFKVVSVITFLGQFDGSYTAFFQVSPVISVSQTPQHGTDVTTRIRYSQVRMTGHDFLDIGTGSFTETNYPGIPTQNPIPANETVENNGGRVFYTSTDQDGNFRVGGLFAIEQSTGIATLNADAFNIAGLQELSLGEVTLGGGSATITEFSTDPFFTADSDSVIPTQRAIKAYIASQIGGGGASLNVNSVTAGSIVISSNEITTTTGGYIAMNAKFEFRGGITGLPLAFNYFLN